ncbi:hypothetical protein NQ318_011610 [Aromia moschata]|uniref:Uncharacterized protein n=1 Tax=Aromia moschata TaxID=1265417 RepID=A0AAV8Z9C0_9CUCU|nr:hypothetical protein NQ318_011610 [Aromia moschata]
MGHVRKVPSKRQAVVDDDTKLNLLLALEENPITPARQLARDICLFEYNHNSVLSLGNHTELQTQIIAVLLQFNPAEPAAIKESQKDVSVETAFKTIHIAYKVGFNVPKSLRCNLNGTPSTPQKATPCRNLNSQDWDGNFRDLQDGLRRALSDTNSIPAHNKTSSISSVHLVDSHKYKGRFRLPKEPSFRKSHPPKKFFGQKITRQNDIPCSLQQGQNQRGGTRGVVWRSAWVVKA